MTSTDWPADLAQLAALQVRLGRSMPEPWVPPAAPIVAASYCCAARGGAAGTGAEQGWAAAAVRRPGADAAAVVVGGALHGSYLPGFLARREGPLRAAALRRLSVQPDVIIVDAAGRDHPRRAGLALHLGAVLDVPTVGATDRPLIARGLAPPDRPGAASPLRVDGELVGYWVRVVSGVRPLAVHAGWRCGPEEAVEVVLGDVRGHRTPQTLRAARRTARAARAVTRC